MRRGTDTIDYAGALEEFVGSLHVSRNRPPVCVVVMFLNGVTDTHYERGPGWTLKQRIVLWHNLVSAAWDAFWGLR